MAWLGRLYRRFLWWFAGQVAEHFNDRIDLKIAESLIESTLDIRAMIAGQVREQIANETRQQSELDLQRLVEDMVYEQVSGPPKRPQGEAISPTDVNALNQRFKQMLKYAAVELAALIPQDIRDRIVTIPLYAFGWTGWKLDDARRTIGSQILVAIGPVGCKNPAGGRIVVLPDGSQHFYHFYFTHVADDTNGRQYEPGDEFEPRKVLTYADVQRLLRASDDELFEFYKRPFERLVQLVVENERPKPAAGDAVVGG